MKIPKDKNAIALPDSSGWWLWYESGDVDRDSERLLVDVDDTGMATIAGDDEWSETTGIEIELNDMGEQVSAFDMNYWEGTDCDSMAGVWVKDSDQSGEPTAVLFRDE